MQFIVNFFGTEEKKLRPKKEFIRIKILDGVVIKFRFNHLFYKNLNWSNTLSRTDVVLSKIKDWLLGSENTYVSMRMSSIEYLP